MLSYEFIERVKVLIKCCYHILYNFVLFIHLSLIALIRLHVKILTAVTRQPAGNTYKTGHKKRKTEESRTTLSRIE